MWNLKKTDGHMGGGKGKGREVSKPLETFFFYVQLANISLLFDVVSNNSLVVYNTYKRLLMTENNVKFDGGR